MALPSSGQISMGDINVELGRTRTTADSSLAGGSTPVGTSLFGLASSSVNKAAPHSLSEFYGYTHTTSTVYTYSTVGSGTLTIPAGVYSVVIEGWGGGGAGGGVTGTAAAGGGGAGGSYAKTSLYVSPGQTLDYTVGAGGTPTATTGGTGGNSSVFLDVDTIVLRAAGGIGGSGGTTNSAFAGASTTNTSIGDLIYRGGFGGTGTTAGSSGGGGSSGKPDAVGTNGSGSTGGTNVPYAAPVGAGANGVAGSSVGATGGLYGGGGSGGHTNNSADRAGGAGGRGYIKITTNTLAPLTTTTTVAPTFAYIEVTNFVDAADININGSYYTTVGADESTGTLSILPGNIELTAYRYSICAGTTIDYSLNGFFVTSFTGGCSATTSLISTSAGNTYSFYIYPGYA